LRAFSDELTAKRFPRLTADKFQQEGPGHALRVVGFLVNVSTVLAAAHFHDAIGIQGRLSRV